MFPENAFMNAWYIFYHNYRKEAKPWPHTGNHSATADTARPFGDAAPVAHAGGVAHAPPIADPGRFSTNEDG